MVPSGADQELAGPGADVAGLAQDRLGRRVEPVELVGGQERRRGLLDQLLVPALQRAVPGGDDHDVAVRVGQALGLDVPRPVQVALDEALAAAERGDRLAGGGLEQLGDLLQLPGHLEPAAAAAERRLDRDRQPVLRRRTPRTSSASATGSAVPGTSGAPTFCAMCRAWTLSPRASMAAGGGPIQISPASITAWAKPAFSARKP